MRQSTVLLIVAMLFGASTTANAQTGRRLAIGGGPNWNYYQDDNFGKRNPGGAVIYRFSWNPNTQNGWKLEPAAGFTWTHADYEPVIAGSEVKVGTLRSVPIMVGGGPAYRYNKTKVGLSVEAGPSFHQFAIDDAGRIDYEDRTGVPLQSVHSDNTLAVRTGVSVWQDLSTRFGLRVGTSYMYDRPNFSTTAGGVTTTEKVKGDYTSFSAGLVVGFF